MELEDVQDARTHASDTGPLVTGGGSSAPKGTAAAFVAAADANQGHGRSLPRYVDRTGSKAGYITLDGSKIFPKGRGVWRVLGRTPSRVLKSKNMPDAARALNLRDGTRGKKRNSGAGLEYEEARQKWFNWAKKHRKQGNIDRVMQSGSPKLEDVEADFEARKLHKYGHGRFGSRPSRRGPDAGGPDSMSGDRPPPDGSIGSYDD